MVFFRSFVVLLRVVHETQRTHPSASVLPNEKVTSISASTGAVLISMWLGLLILFSNPKPTLVTLYLGRIVRFILSARTASCNRPRRPPLRMHIQLTIQKYTQKYPSFYYSSSKQQNYLNRKQAWCLLLSQPPKIVFPPLQRQLLSLLVERWNAQKERSRTIKQWSLTLPSVLGTNLRAWSGCSLLERLHHPGQHRKTTPSTAEKTSHFLTLPPQQEDQERERLLILHLWLASWIASTRYWAFARLLISESSALLCEASDARLALPIDPSTPYSFYDTPIVSNT